MTLETIYYIGQTIAVIAIVLSLVFVGIQIRQNTQQAQLQNSAHLQERYDLCWTLLIQDAPLAAAYDRIFRGERVSTEEAAQLRLWISVFANVTMTAYFARNENVATDKIHYESETFYLNCLTRPFFWKMHQTVFRAQLLAADEHLSNRKSELIKQQDWLDHIENKRAVLVGSRERSGDAPSDRDTSTLTKPDGDAS